MNEGRRDGRLFISAHTTILRVKRKIRTCKESSFRTLIALIIWKNLEFHTNVISIYHVTMITCLTKNFLKESFIFERPKK